MTNGKTICTVCNYIFDETIGESRQAIPDRVHFEDLPDTWRCPGCGSPKEMFQPCSCANFLERDIHFISQSTPVGELVTEHPLRACVLEQYGIDYCCGGNKTLEQACMQKGVPVTEVLEKLLASDSKNVSLDESDWTKTKLKELIDHIVTSYHNPLRQELPRIAHLAEKVAKVHGGNHPEMIEVLNVFNTFREQLELHMQKEEAILFLGIVSIEAGAGIRSFGCGGSIEHPIEVMTQEHDEAGTALCTIRKLTNNFTAPPDACNTFKVLLYSLAQLESEMHQHVHKENNLLFPRAIALHKLKPAAAGS